ncbi:hypothetical protein MSG28_001013 [Choristoneura fumiferana]|uniref:Uncharacterized protein n=1 Tax=Choristoneura fumiferana TaxID=7141 RepID=A0ACC0K352_CHOFU|nr:hypothetical protein MSG28_001013 [Choristoneura fumiferana]
MPTRINKFLITTGIITLEIERNQVTSFEANSDDKESDEHSIHKMGALNAYELQKREDAWQQQQEAELPFSRG